MAMTQESKSGKLTMVEQMEQTMAQVMVDHGKAQGEVLAARRIMFNILTARFGEISASMRKVIEAAETEQLERWIMIAATAESMEAVGLDIARSVAEEAEIHTARRMLLSLLTARFRTVSPAVASTIKTAEIKQIEKWVTVAATAVSLEAVGIVI